VGVVDIRIFDAIPQFGDFRNMGITYRGGEEHGECIKHQHSKGNQQGLAAQSIKAQPQVMKNQHKL
jgi:hypothetical protein